MNDTATQPARRGSVWSVVALISTAVAWSGVLDFSSLSVFAAAPAALLALIAGTLGVIRDRRPVWRVVAGLAAVASLGLVVVMALWVFILSAGGPTT